MTDFQRILASRKRMKREEQLAQLASLAHWVYGWFIFIIVGVPFLAFVLFSMVACRLMGRGR